MQIIKGVCILIVISLVSCSKDKIPSHDILGDKECYNFQEAYNLNFVSERFAYKNPCLNPLNSNEIVFYFQDNEQSINQLIKYDIQTKKKTTILDVSYKIANQPKWSRKGWIAYTRAIGYVDHVFVLKDNGDSLRQFSINTANHFPTWDASGDYLYWAHSQFLGNSYFYLKRGLYEDAIDTVLRDSDVYAGISFSGDVSNNNRLVSQTLINNIPTLAVSDLDNAKLEFDALKSNIVGLLGLTWASDGTIYYSIRKEGLFKFSFESGYSKLIMPFCDSKRYGKISCSADGKFIIGERIDSRLNLDSQGSPDKIIEKSSIYKIDLATMEETKLNLE